MSATIRIRILSCTDIRQAYSDCVQVSFSLGGISVETEFNGIEMSYHGQSREQWCDEYHHRLATYGKKEEK